MNTSDYRRIARENLAGNWGNAILAAFLAALLGGLVTTSGFNFEIELDSEIYYELPPLLQTCFHILAVTAGAFSLVHFILGGVIRQGYCVYLLKQYDRRNPETSDVFSQFHRFGDGFCLLCLQNLFTALWTLLFIIPGIVASYSYSMAPFIMAEHSEMTAREALTASKTLMDGHKAELFFLKLSYFGWGLLCALTLGIGTLWLNPYVNAAHAAFYRDLRYTSVDG